MRITTNAILRNYNKNLSTSMKNLDMMRSRVMTQRKFMSTSEDPSSALRATSLEHDSRGYPVPPERTGRFCNADQ